MSRAQTPNDAASIQSALTAPTRVMSPPASAYAKKPARRSVVLSRPVTRSSGTRAARAMSGMRVSLAESPGPRKAPAMATSTRSVGKCSRPNVWRSGTRPTTAVLAVSATTLTRRAPTLSISGPPTAFTSTSGVISAIATRPVLTGEPVVIRTNHGIAMALTRVPQIDTTFATRNATSGARFPLSLMCLTASLYCRVSRGKAWIWTVTCSAPSGRGAVRSGVLYFSSTAMTSCIIASSWSARRWKK